MAPGGRRFGWHPWWQPPSGWALQRFSLPTFLCIISWHIRWTTWMRIGRWKCGSRLPTLGLVASFSFIISCGGQIDPSSSPGVAGAATNSFAECLDLVFQSAPDASTGIVACPVETDPVPQVDLFAIRPEACAGRGLGLPVAPNLCRSDEDCPDGSSCRSNGFCYGPIACDADSECGSGSACACAGMFSTDYGYSGVIGYNQCVQGDCRADSDCAGYACGVSSTQPCGKVDGFFCHSNADDCLRSADCGTDLTCGYNKVTHRWVCLSIGDRICDSGL